jgi:Mn-dependent DtxR family transcriptional regulator
VVLLKSNEETLNDLKIVLLRIGSTNQRDYDLLKKKGQVYITTICRRLKLSWPEVMKKLDEKKYFQDY